MRKTLLTETIDAIKGSGHAVSDVVCVASRDGEYECSWAHYETIADVEYDSGFGWAEVACDLIVLFTDGTYMTRGEYDGSEWWEYNAPFKRMMTPKPINRVISNDYLDNVREMNMEAD